MRALGDCVRVQKMNISVQVRTEFYHYGDQTILLIGPFFSHEQPDFGPALREIEVHCYFSSGEVSQAIRSDFGNEYGESLRALPKNQFFRKKARAEISYVSQIGDWRLVKEPEPLNPGLFAKAAREIAGVIGGLGVKLKRTDAFDFAAFSTWLQGRLNHLPETTEALEAFKASYYAAQEALRKAHSHALSEGDQLDIDWTDYHTQARALLGDVFFWEVANDFAPHGNDSGADLLDAYMRWRKRARKASAMVFFEKFLRGWDIDLAHPPTEGIMVVPMEEASIALAFAQVKVDGRCEQPVRALSLAAITRCRARLTTQHADWPLLAERLRTLELMERTLEAVEAGGGT